MATKIKETKKDLEQEKRISEITHINRLINNTAGLEQVDRDYFYLDIDYNCLPYEMLERITNNISEKKLKEIKVYRSSSLNGWHFEVYLLNKISLKEIYHYRFILDDDLQRIKYSLEDFKNGFSDEILFHQKKIKGVWKTRQHFLTVKFNL